MEYTISTSEYFDKWFSRLKDKKTKTKVLARLARIENGNFGDHKEITEGLFELRFFFGGGIRIYDTVLSGEVVLLLVGGDKSSQSKDIKKASKLITDLE